MKENELKLCPFCGGEAKEISFTDPRSMRPACTILCTKCNAKIDDFVAEDNTFSYRDKAIEHWNRRADNERY